VGILLLVFVKAQHFPNTREVRRYASTPTLTQIRGLHTCTPKYTHTYVHVGLRVCLDPCVCVCACQVYGATVGVGILGMAGNKGGASLRFRFYDSHLCFGKWAIRVC
jgi:hypothetical protein